MSESKNKVSPEVSNIVVGGVTRPSTRIKEGLKSGIGFLARKKKLAYICTGVLLLVIAGSVFALQRDSAEPKAQHTVRETPEQVDKRVIASRMTVLEGLIKKEKNFKKKQAYQSELSVLYVNQGTYDKGMELALAVEEAQQSAASAAAIADIHYAQQDFANAAKYYERAMSRSDKPQSPSERSPYNDYALLKKQSEEAAQQ